MDESVRIPVGCVLQLDDVGWDNGRDLRTIGQASRSGIPRFHTKEDYELLHEIGKAINSKVLVALCLGDWDRDNILRGVVGATHDPWNWDRASEIDIEKFTGYRDILENSDFVEYTIHGLLHGNYDVHGRLISESEGFVVKRFSDTHWYKKLVSDDYFNEHLDLFMKIYNRWGFTQRITTYIAPCGMIGITEEDVDHITKILYDRGIRYWTNTGFPFDAPLKVYNGVACVKQNTDVLVSYHAPWEGYDIDPTTFPQFYQEEKKNNAALLALHWTNILRFNPKKNFEQVEPWANYFKEQNEVFGYMTARDFEASVNQLFYFWFADLKVENNKCIIDLAPVMHERLDCHQNFFYISFQKGTVPANCRGGIITLHERHRDFDTYKIEHTENRVEINL